MDITPLVATGASIIQSYAEGRFRISGQVFDGPVLVLTDRVQPWSIASPPGREDMLTLSAYADQLDVILLGCGRAVPADMLVFRKDLQAAGLHVEFMDTGAACRTFNVLMSEGRRVAAALLPL